MNAIQVQAYIAGVAKHCTARTAYTAHTALKYS